MWNRILFTVIIIFIMVHLVGAQDVRLPEGEGKEIVQTKCSICHNLEIVISQRLNRDEWNDIVERMMRWGAPVETTEERKIIVEYLSTNFGKGK
ncbi:MAG: hypothetical protein N2257_07795 [Thermodesulfovibrionales bacterium]|nr:hypothetical protein [Thermodesulfovibrionales bacterium]